MTRSSITPVHARPSEQTEEHHLDQQTPATVVSEFEIAGPAPGEDNPERLAEKLGLTFRNLDLMRQALTHRSVLHDWIGEVPGVPTPLSNERLEFLGDAVLGLVVAEELFHHFPEATEGEL